MPAFLKGSGHNEEETESPTVSSQMTTKVDDTEILGLTTSLVGTSLEDKSSPVLVSTLDIDELIQAIDASPTYPPSLTPVGRTLKGIFENPSVPKVFFDVRNDSDALYSHFGVSLAGVQDLQLMELATRSFPRRRVNGLAKCIEHDAPMTPGERRAWSVAKEKGKDLFAPERGGSYEVFNVRPLPTEIIQYCIQDVQFLPKLWTKYNGKLSTLWARKVNMEVQNRIQLSRSHGYNGKGPHMALAPKGWS